MSDAIEVGRTAPDFTLPDADGEPVSLSDLRGQPVVVYFYPKDDTPGCTTQACDIRDHWGEFQDEGAAVLVDRDGNVVAHWPKVRPKEHTDQVLEAIRQLG